MSTGPLAPCLERHVLPALRVGLAPLGMLGPWVSRMVVDEGSVLGGTEWVVRRAPVLCYLLPHGFRLHPSI